MLTTVGSSLSTVMRFVSDAVLSLLAPSCAAPAGTWIVTVTLISIRNRGRYRHCIGPRGLTGPRTGGSCIRQRKIRRVKTGHILTEGNRYIKRVPSIMSIGCTNLRHRRSVYINLHRHLI